MPQQSFPVVTTETTARHAKYPLGAGHLQGGKNWFLGGKKNLRYYDVLWNSRRETSFQNSTLPSRILLLGIQLHSGEGWEKRHLGRLLVGVVMKKGLRNPGLTLKTLTDNTQHQVIHIIPRSLFPVELQSRDQPLKILCRWVGKFFNFIFCWKSKKILVTWLLLF